MARATGRELKPGVARRYDQLRRRYRRDDLYRALVDMYRNVSFEDEVSSHWMALHDVEKYVDARRFQPLLAGYDDRELEFLAGRGIKVV